MKSFNIFFFICMPFFLFGQKWVDTTYTIQSIEDIHYGTAIDFAGNSRDLYLDLYSPTNDSIPECGRPLLIAVHGGAFLAGDKGSGLSKRISQDFARRGYTTASVNYRLGLFHTNQNKHCNTPGWNCWNMADTSEWYRGWYRGMQDVKGAIRYLVNHAGLYDIDPNQIFVTGESAGGFIAMGVGFLDDSTEVQMINSGLLPDVLPPNPIYEAPCIQHPDFNLDTSIMSMDLSRPDLGHFDGQLNQPAGIAYQIKGVGNFFGAVFNNIFHTSAGTAPVLYMYHQPNDLLVPYDQHNVLAGLAWCYTQFPFNCPYIINRPYVYGSKSIRAMIDSMAAAGMVSPAYFFDSTTNNANCAQQLLNPALSGHAVDNYWLRTGNMASFFADQIDSCQNVGISPLETRERQFQLYPNPASKAQIISIEGPLHKVQRFILMDVNGRIIQQNATHPSQDRIQIRPEALKLTSGLYILQLFTESAFEAHTFMVH